MALRKFFWPLLITLIGVTLLLSLGVWQLKRLTWKQELIAILTTNQSLPVSDLSTLLQSTPQQITFRQVRAVGTFDYNHDLYLVGRVVDGKRGSFVVTPLILANGQKILVNRGWIPLEAPDKELTNPMGQVEVVGTMREKMARNLFTPTNNYTTREIFTIDPSEVAQIKHLTGLLPYYMEASSIHPRGLMPLLRPQVISLRNFHLLYAITWFVLAGFLASVLFIYIRSSLSLKNKES